MDNQLHIQVLARDPQLSALLKRVPAPEPIAPRDPYTTLLKAIVSQQLSTKAAATIWKRFEELFPEKHPEASHVLQLSDESLRGVGLSGQKAGYVRNIARYHLNTPLEAGRLANMPDEDIIRELTSIKGVGQWTVEMQLIFSLGRPDVFPIDDLGIRQAMVRLYGLTHQGKALRAEMIRIAEPWRPYRSFASRLLWDWKDK